MRRKIGGTLIEFLKEKSNTELLFIRESAKDLRDHGLLAAVQREMNQRLNR